MKTIIICIALIPYFLSAVSLAQDFEEVFLAYDPDSAISDNFGYSVGISGNYLVIGAHLEDEDVAGENTMGNAGSAFIYERDENGNWNWVQKIVASDRIENTIFGFSVSISGNFAIVGAPHNNTDISGGNYMLYAGAAYIFKRNVYGNWSEVQKIVASDRDVDDCFGYSVSISGNYAVVGAYREDEDSQGLNTLSDAGSAYIYQCDESGNWNEMQKIVSSDREESDYFGEAVSISDHYIIVSAYREDEDTSGLNTMVDAGSAYIFELDGNQWNEVQKITAPVRESYDLFGKSVAISENYAIIGAHYEDEDAEETNSIQNSGSAYIFRRTSAGTWNLAQKIVASDRAEDDAFGISAGISGNYAIVGAHYEDEDVLGDNTIEDAGSAYIFHCDEAGNWSQTQKIVASDRGYNDFAGCSAGISGNYLILGRGEASPWWAGAANIFESCTSESISDPDNIIENGSFSTCVLFPWTIYTAASIGQSLTYQLINGRCMLTPHKLTATPEVWDMQFIQILSPSQLNRLTEGLLYTLSFDASAESDNRLIHLYFGVNTDPWIPDLDEDIYLSTEMESYEVDFTLSSKYSTMKLAFDLGSELNAFTLDNVRLVEKVTDAVSDPAVSSPRIYPNPATDYFKVAGAKACTIKLYNSSGILIHSTIIENNNYTSKTEGMPAGIYVVKVSSEVINAVSKLVIR